MEGGFKKYKKSEEAQEDDVIWWTDEKSGI